MGWLMPIAIIIIDNRSMGRIENIAGLVDESNVEANVLCFGNNYWECLDLVTRSPPWISRKVKIRM